MELKRAKIMTQWTQCQRIVRHRSTWKVPVGIQKLVPGYERIVLPGVPLEISNSQRKMVSWMVFLSHLIRCLRPHGDATDVWGNNGWSGTYTIAWLVKLDDVQMDNWSFTKQKLDTRLWFISRTKWLNMTSPTCGDGSKPWYLVNPKIAGKWMFIPLKMVLIGIDPYPCINVFSANFCDQWCTLWESVTVRQLENHHL